MPGGPDRSTLDFTKSLEGLPKNIEGLKITQDSPDKHVPVLPVGTALDNPFHASSIAANPGVGKAVVQPTTTRDFQPSLAQDQPAPKQERHLRTPDESARRINAPPTQSVMGAAITEGAPAPQPSKSGLDGMIDWAKENPVKAATMAAAAIYLIQTLLKSTAGVGNGGSFLGAAGTLGVGTVLLKGWQMYTDSQEAKAKAEQGNKVIGQAITKSPEFAKLVQDQPDLRKVFEKKPELVQSLMDNPLGLHALANNPESVKNLLNANGIDTSSQEATRTLLKRAAVVMSTGGMVTPIFLAKDMMGTHAETQGRNQQLTALTITNPNLAKALAANPSLKPAVLANPHLMDTVFNDPAQTRVFLSKTENVQALLASQVQPGVMDRLMVSGAKITIGWTEQGKSAIDSFWNQSVRKAQGNLNQEATRIANLFAPASALKPIPGSTQAR